VLLDAYWSAFREGGADGWPVRLRLRTYKPSWEAGPDQIETWVEAHAREVSRLHGGGGGAWMGVDGDSGEREGKQCVQGEAGVRGCTK
jgi:hypothetical protein